jgi:hypothetical protein
MKLQIYRCYIVWNQRKLMLGILGAALIGTLGKSFVFIEPITDNMGPLQDLLSSTPYI